PDRLLVCADAISTAREALGSLAFGIGISEVEHILATQRAKNMRITVEGQLPEGVPPKDVILHNIGVIGTARGT
ncbi:aconitase-domain-containing protein, partial [Peniophora sp. CONT]